MDYTAIVNTHLHKHLGGLAVLGSPVYVTKVGGDVYSFSNGYGLNTRLELVPISEAARWMGCHRNTIKRLINQGDLGTIQLDNGYRMVFVRDIPDRSNGGRKAITPEATAKRIGLSRVRVYQLMRSGDLEHMRFSARKTRIFVDSIDEFIKKRVAKYGVQL